MKKQSDDKEIVKMFLALFLILLVAFAIGYFIRSKSKPKVLTEESNGFTFTKSGSSWYTTILNPVSRQVITADFRYPPSQIKDIPVIGDPRLFIKGIVSSGANAAYFTYNPYQNTSYVALSYADLAKFLNKLNGINLALACTTNQTTECADLPVVTCDSKKDLAMVIYMKPSNITRITMDNTCLTIEGSGLNLTRAYDKLFFIWYNII